MAAVAVPTTYPSAVEAASPARPPPASPMTYAAPVGAPLPPTAAPPPPAYYAAPAATPTAAYYAPAYAPAAYAPPKPAPKSSGTCVVAFLLSILALVAVIVIAAKKLLSRTMAEKYSSLCGGRGVTPLTQSGRDHFESPDPWERRMQHRAMPAGYTRNESERAGMAALADEAGGY